jgi:quercetin dioxygenase-like cupin family protein
MDTARRSLCLALPALVASLTAEPESLAAVSADDQTITSFVKPFDQLPVKQNGINASRAILNGKTESGCVMEVHETTLGPGMSPHPPHHHKHDEMFLMSKGSLEVTIAGKAATIGPGSAAYVHSEEEHGVRNRAPSMRSILSSLPGRNHKQRTGLKPRGRDTLQTSRARPSSAGSR